MTKFVEKYFAPILGEAEAQLLEDFATKFQQGKIKDDVNQYEVAHRIVGGYCTDITEYIKPTHRVYSQATIDKRYNKALEKLNAKYGKGGNQ